MCGRRARNGTFWMSWNEIEVVHVQRFLEPDIIDFTDAVDATNHIFDRRCEHRVQEQLFHPLQNVQTS